LILLLRKGSHVPSIIELQRILSVTKKRTAVLTRGAKTQDTPLTESKVISLEERVKDEAKRA
jgi:hypothetical protein